jgi:hypothetical protein
MRHGVCQGVIIVNVENYMGVDYRRHLVGVAELPGVLRDVCTGVLVPLQAAPALATDGGASGEVVLALLDLAAGQTLTLERDSGTLPVTIQVEAADDVLEITNGDLAVRIPREGEGDSGPIAAVRVGDRPWQGRSGVSGLAGSVSVSSRIVSLGPCLVQWETVMACPGGGTLKIQMRWASGSDTIQVVEEGDADTSVTWPGSGL